MEPKIYKPGAYKSPGVYKGAGGIYKGRGVYNDGAGGGSPVWPSGLVLLEYFNKHFGEEKTSGTINNYSFDNTCPVNIPGGAPVADNTDFTHLVWNTSLIKNICNSGEYTIDFWAKNIELSNTSNSAPLAGFVDSGDYWQSMFAMYCNETSDSKVWCWGNDSNRLYGNSTSQEIHDIDIWRNYVISEHNNVLRFYVDGKYGASFNLTNRNSWFQIYNKFGNRNIMRLAQIALYDYALHTDENDFVVSNDPIYYV